MLVLGTGCAAAVERVLLLVPFLFLSCCTSQYAKPAAGAITATYGMAFERKLGLRVEDGADVKENFGEL